MNNQITTEYTFTPDSGQCAEEVKMTVMVDQNQADTPTFTQIAPVCFGASLTLPTTSDDGFTGTWSPAVDTTQTTEYTFTPDADQCAAIVKMTVDVTPPVNTPTFTQIAPVCFGASLTLPTTSDDGFTGSWSPAVDTTQTTEYTFTPDADQCAAIVKMTVVVNPLIPVTFDPINPICEGGNFILPTTSNEGIVGSWSPAIDNTQTTEYTFIPDPGQGECIEDVKITVVVTPSIIPTFIDIPVAICFGDANFSSLPINSVEGITGSWSPAIDNIQTTEYTFTPDAGQGCVEEVKVTVVVNPAGALFIDVEAQDKIVECDGSGNVTEFSDWLSNNGGAVVNTQLDWTHNYQGGLYDLDCNGNVEVTFTGKDACGNIIETKATFKIEDTKKPEFVGDLPQDANVFDCDELNTRPTLTATDNCDTNVVVTFNEDKEGNNPVNYVLIRTWTATDLCGNQTTHTQRLNVLCTPKFEVYNGISANGDGLNDIFYIKGIEDFPNNVVRIFNRWGVEVYKESGYDNQTKYWDGTSSGSLYGKQKIAPEGTYYYIIEYTNFDNEVVKHTGYIYLTQ